MIVDDFNKITGLDVGKYFSDFTSFVDINLNRIINYYTGVEKNPDIQSFQKLVYLVSESDKFNEAIIKNDRRFNKSEYWNIMDALDEIRTRLSTTENTYKWVRSTTAKGDLNINSEVEDVLGQFNTIEDVAKRNGYQDPINSWSDIAMRNDLDEEDYTPSGGNILKVNMIGRRSIIIDDVVDRLFGDNMYGKDINVIMSYIDNDLDTVTGYDCMVQSYETLLGMRRGDVPEFSDMGVSAAAGGNISSFAYPVILRQLQQVFYSDSSVDSISIIEFKVVEDNVAMGIAISSKLGKSIKRGLSI